LGIRHAIAAIFRFTAMPIVGMAQDPVAQSNRDTETGIT
jgi:hypothetical protein